MSNHEDSFDRAAFLAKHNDVILFGEPQLLPPFAGSWQTSDSTVNVAIEDGKMVEYEFLTLGAIMKRGEEKFPSLTTEDNQ